MAAVWGQSKVGGQSYLFAAMDQPPLPKDCSASWIISTVGCYIANSKSCSWKSVFSAKDIFITAWLSTILSLSRAIQKMNLICISVSLAVFPLQCRANEEIAQVRNKAKAESAALHAGLRKEQMKVESLERALQQKVKEPLLSFSCCKEKSNCLNLPHAAWNSFNMDSKMYIEFSVFSWSCDIAIFYSS